MKLIKKTMAIIAAVLVSGAAFAQSAPDIIGLAQSTGLGLSQGGLGAATAGAVNDDVSYFFDAYDWNKLSYGKFYGFTSINSNSSANVAYATKVNGDSLNVAWEGDLWGTAMPEVVMALYGHGNMSFAGSLILDDTGDDLSAMPTLRFGMNYSSQIGFGAGFSYLHFTVADVTKLSMPVFTADGIFRVKSSASESLNAKMLFSFAPATYTITLGGTTYTTNYNFFEIMPAVDWQKKLSSTFNFGLKASAPLVVYGMKAEGSDSSSSSVILSPVVQAGFSAAVKPNQLLLNAGIVTELPSLTFVKDSDVAKGAFENIFFGGFTYFATSNVTIDLTSQLVLEDGISIGEMFYQTFALSVSAKF